MIIDCCAQQRSYEKFFGLLGQVNELFGRLFVCFFVRLFDCPSYFLTTGGVSTCLIILLCLSVEVLSTQERIR